ncbi:sigma 54-interacting transcriptional regulator [candidate division TA06 bacterium]|uniref:Sigma 54-interacting transcriptional regulator n=1 Tax=candidate division TA06 bacterium TaxID=2250710 RepID=A0A933IDR4_UNCT6|nr:sigma 54-interacting transcriptional regulator [candidate division TA06 bacterium]
MSNRWQRYELETKLAGFLIVLVLLVINLSGIWLVYKTKSRMDSIQLSHMELLGGLAQAEMEKAKDLPKDSLWSSWQRLAQRTGLVGIGLLDGNGRWVIKYDKYRPWNLTPENYEKPLTAMPPSASFSENGLAISPAYGRLGLFYFTAFYKAGQGQSILALEYPAGEEAAIARAANIQVLTGAIGFGLISIIGLFYLRNIFSPFRQMARSARSKMGEASSDRADSDVDLVVKTYDQMIEQLKAKGQTLQQLYDNALDRAEQSELIKKQIVDSIDKALITIGKNGEVTSFNRAAAQLAGGEEAAQISRWLKENNLLGLIENKKPWVWEAKHPKYGLRYLQAELYNLADPAGQNTGSIIAVTDITEAKNMEEQARLYDGALLMAQASQKLLERIKPEIAALKDPANAALAQPGLWQKRLSEIERAVEDLGQYLTYQPAGIPETSGSEIIHVSKGMSDALEMAQKVAKTESTALLTGESGTGKELVARAIHRQSPRNKGPFVSINCGALPETLLESELFGYLKGAFTGAYKDKPGLLKAAEGGTFFLDEIGELPLSLQVKLLRALQEREATPVGGARPFKVDVRFIAATNQNPEQLVKSGKFRQDLYFRLNVFPIELPPLRQRPEDIILLAEHFAEKHCRKVKTPVKHFTRDSLEILTGYQWPGNVRELENAVERAVVMAEGNLIKPEHLNITEGKVPNDPKVEKDLGLLEVSARAAAASEAQMIKEMLKETGGNKSEASRRLKISYRVMLKKIKDYQLE